MTPLSKQQRQEIEARVQLFHDNVDGKRDALIEGKPYSQDMAMAMNEVTMITESIPSLLASDAEREAEVERLRGLFQEIEYQAHGHFCYVCTRAKCDGHASECPVGKALTPSST